MEKASLRLSDYRIKNTGLDTVPIKTGVRLRNKRPIFISNAHLAYLSLQNPGYREKVHTPKNNTLRNESSRSFGVYRPAIPFPAT